MPAHDPSAVSPRQSRRGVAALYERPYLLLILATLFWSGNFIVGRAVHESVPPVALAFCRWFGGFLVVIGVAWPHVRRDWPRVRRHWPMLLLLAATGISAYNTLVYVGLGSTTALNGLLMQSTMPVVILACSFVLFRDRPSLRQVGGIVVSLAGVVVIVTQGRPVAIGRLAPTPGDLWIFAAVVAYAVYSVLLRRRPAIHPLSFLAVTFGLGSAMLVPLLAWESAAGTALRLDGLAIFAIVYVAIFPSVLAYFCWNRGVEMVGANRAGQFMHLLPVFGSAMAILILGEDFRGFHAIGAALIFAGILLAARGR
ncbi:MAG TPA: DMT family transporter [Stellaceae bacterium]|nr:DMT family transporter [Stellaceae bacterium]